MDKHRYWTLAAEVVSALAVVITLVFVILEMRNSTNATQAQTYQLIMQELNAYRRFMNEPDIVAIELKIGDQGWDSLSRFEQRRMFTTAAMNWGVYESAYYANRRGVLGSSEWARFESGYCRRKLEQPWAWNQNEFTSMTALLTPEFVDFLQQLCD